MTENDRMHDCVMYVLAPSNLYNYNIYTTRTRTPPSVCEMAGGTDYTPMASVLEDVGLYPPKGVE